jgi:hypothetical protein
MKFIILEVVHIFIPNNQLVVKIAYGFYIFSDIFVFLVCLAISGFYYLAICIDFRSRRINVVLGEIKRLKLFPLIMASCSFWVSLIDYYRHFFTLL